MKTIIGSICFLFILLWVLLSVNRLFITGYVFGYDDRIPVVGLKEEQKDSLDVIYIGGSAALTYWEPMKAYHDCGFTSYDLATSAIQIESIPAYIKYAQKYQNPALYVIGIRVFSYYTEEGIEEGLRLTSDAMELGPNKIHLIREYMKNHITDTDEVSLYLELIKYHTNYDVLSDEMAWHLMDNKEKCDYKGCIIQSDWCYLQEPLDYKTEERALLPENAKKVFLELLDYLDDHNINAIFVVCPYAITKEHYAIYNTVGDLVNSHGYVYLNTNDYYNEMELDFSTDFYDPDHVNAIGAEKYTIYLEQYLKDHYELPDHRGDVEYARWDELTDRFTEEAEESKQSVRESIAKAEQALKQGDEIRKTFDFSKWASYVKDSRYSLLFVGDGKNLVTESSLDKKVLENLGVDTNELFATDCYIKAIVEEDDWEEPNVVDDTLTVLIGNARLRSSATIDNQDKRCSIIIDGTECSRQDPDGINVVVFDNYHRTTIDSVTLKQRNGCIEIER